MTLKIAIITASTRDARVGKNITDWFYGQVKGAPDIEFEIIDLQQENLPFLNEPKSPAQGDYALESTKKWSEKISKYDGFVFVTPEYNHGYPATLKNAIDTLYAEWQKKPVAFVGYGVLGAPRSIEQLIQVTSQIGMVPLGSKAMHIIESYKAIDENGDMNQAHAKGASPENLVKELIWWVRLLKPIR